jgi:plastocyanin
MMTPNNATGSRSRSRRLWTVLAVAAVALVALVVGADLAGRGLADQGDLDDPVAGVTEVAVRDNDFAPEAIEVPAGTTVTWRWEGDNRHNVVGDGFESPVQAEGVFAHTFAAPGTYEYECTLHPFMRGEVVVTEEPAV